MPEQQQAQLRQLASNFGGRPLRVVPGAASFRHTTLSPAHVTLLRLGLSAFTPSNPILLEPAKSPSIRRLSETTNDCAVQRLAQLFEIPGFAFEVRFHPEVLVERLCQHLRSQGEEDAAKTVKEQSTAKLGAVGPQASHLPRLVFVWRVRGGCFWRTDQRHSGPRTCPYTIARAAHGP